MKNRYLLDTNVFIYAFNKGLELPEAYYYTSSICKNEILSCPKISKSEKESIEEIFKDIQILDQDKSVQKDADTFANRYNLSKPDAIICATAYVYDLTLITNDPTLHQVKEIEIEHFYFS